MIPEQFFNTWVVVNLAALAVLAIAFLRASFVRWTFTTVFLVLSAVTTVAALHTPWDFTKNAAFTPFTGYQHFIEGPFSRHVAAFVLPVAAIQFAIAVLLGMPERWRHWGERFALAFFMAVTPLGIGAFFPLPLIAIAAIVVMEKELYVAEHFPRPARPAPAQGTLAYAHPRAHRWHLPSIHWHARH